MKTEIRITQMSIVENHDLIKARFDYIVKMGDFELAVKGYSLTERSSMFKGKDFGIMAYSSSFEDSRTGELKWHAKSKPNTHLESKILEEAKQIYATVAEKGLTKVGFKDLLAFYNEQVTT